MNDMTPSPSVLTGQPDERLTKVELVYRALRADIVALALSPGATIDKSSLCRRLDVSRFPVSEALSRLAREGLVSVEPQRGSYVALLDLTEIRAATFLRRAIECEAVRVAANAADSELIGRLRSLLDRQRVLAEAGDADGFDLADVAFHHAIVASTDLKYVMDVNAVATAHLDRARRATLPRRDRLHAVVKEHEPIVAALANRDGEAAAAALRAHLDSMLAAVELLLEERPELARDGDALAIPAAAAS